MKLKSIIVLSALTLTGCAQTEGYPYRLSDVGTIFTVGGNNIGYVRNANANQGHYSSDHEEAMAMKREHDAKMDAIIAAEQAKQPKNSPFKRQCEINWKLGEAVLQQRLMNSSIHSYEANYKALNNHRLAAYSKVEKCIAKAEAKAK